uniref:Uncharacterized protein n=1 Tax=Romanomermis culicivorax TaxID=13658 RepID=A0A915HVF4_ROMCU
MAFDSLLDESSLTDSLSGFSSVETYDAKSGIFFIASQMQKRNLWKKRKRQRDEERTRQILYQNSNSGTTKLICEPNNQPIWEYFAIAELELRRLLRRWALDQILAGTAIYAFVIERCRRGESFMSHDGQHAFYLRRMLVRNRLQRMILLFQQAPLTMHKATSSSTQKSGWRA